MHEMSICEGVIQLLEESAHRESFKRVTQLWLDIGALSGVEISALTFCFDVVSKNTLAEGAQLHINQLPAMAWCMPCGHTVVINQRFDACPDCGSHQLQVTAGDEMKIRELEVA